MTQGASRPRVVRSSPTSMAIAAPAGGLVPDRRALVDALYRAHAVALVRLAREKYQVPAGDAEAVVHDVFTKLLERPPFELRNARSWLYSAVAFKAQTYWRDAKPASPLPTSGPFAIEVGGSTAASRLEARLTVDALLVRLQPKCATVLRQKFCEERSLQDLAETFATTKPYANVLVQRCLAKVRALVIQEARRG